jgi:hypothetical protein
MAINPNTDFSSGAVLTAAQQNRFPRGVMAYNQLTSNSAGFTTTAQQITGSAFTAVANRYYRITYYEPSIVNTTTSDCILSIRNGSTQLQAAIINVNNSFSNAGVCQLITTFSAGSVTLNTALRSPSSGTGTAGRGADRIAFLLVEDIGPS